MGWMIGLPSKLYFYFFILCVYSELFRPYTLGLRIKQTPQMFLFLRCNPVQALTFS